MKVPNHDLAQIPARKLTAFLLSESHPKGRHKARLFRAFGFSAASPGEFAAALLAHLREHDPANYKHLRGPEALREFFTARMISPVLYEMRAILAQDAEHAHQRGEVFEEAVRFLASVPDEYALAREHASEHLAQWARIPSEAVTRLTHQREDASELRERVVNLEAAVMTARELVGAARIPLPTPGMLGHALDAHERLLGAHTILTRALPFPAHHTEAAREEWFLARAREERDLR